MCGMQNRIDPLSHVALPLALLCLLGGTAVGLTAVNTGPERSEIPVLETVVIPSRTFTYRPDGEYRKGGSAIDAPLTVVGWAAAFSITKYHVTAGEYEACVADGQCLAPENKAPADHPVTGVSYDDAMAYARWISGKTGYRYRLPTDIEMAQAAGTLFPDEALNVADDPSNPAVRWIAQYEREAALRRSTTTPTAPKGTFGENEFGLTDFGGNVWEWTGTCHRRVYLNASGLQTKTESACGVYVAVGRHRSPMSSIVRDPKGGGCSVGAPPANLGFRLVMEDTMSAKIGRLVRKFVISSKGKRTEFDADQI